MFNTRKICFNPETQPPVEAKMVIRVAKDSWGVLPYNRLKNKLMVFRLFKKEFIPMMISKDPLRGQDGWRITLEPYNF